MFDPSKVTLENFIAFAQTKPRDEVYHYTDNGNCPIAQFLKSLGATLVFVVPGEYILGSRWNPDHAIPFDWRLDACALAGSRRAIERTWDALLNTYEANKTAFATTTAQSYEEFEMEQYNVQR